ncbi:Histidine kinase 5 [Grifola frondosa]|uniref:histidine kinase n=1 Tax=Grifola frondosa TaxID=5627 RepID=A0A1C7M9X9_GRIFR|nr:Histidine kinase 5 [Grifola frondosa]
MGRLTLRCTGPRSAEHRSSGGAEYGSVWDDHGRHRVSGAGGEPEHDVKGSQRRTGLQPDGQRAVRVGAEAVCVSSGDAVAVRAAEAGDGRAGLGFVTDLDENVDSVARRALYEAMGMSAEAVSGRMKECEDEAGIVVGDETRLRQIITNLASNACKFTPSGGKLVVRTRLVLPQLAHDADEDVDVDVEEMSVRNGSGNGSGSLHRLSTTLLSQHNVIHSKPAPPLEWIVVRIEVTDTGYGIRPKDMVQSKLFSAFNQTEQGRLQGGKGTGLGLALVRQIVKLSGGRLGVQSKVNEGSTFWVELPLGVGRKAIPGLMSSAQLDDETIHTSPRRAVHTSRSPRTVVLSEPDPDRSAWPLSPSASALHSIMEQGGLVEISTKRGEKQAVLTRTIGDPSTGTGPPLDPSPLPDEQRPAPIEGHSSDTQWGGDVVERVAAVRDAAERAGGGRRPADAEADVAHAHAPRVRGVDGGEREMALDMILNGRQRETPSSEDTGCGGLSLDSATPGSQVEECSWGRDFVVGVTGNALLTDQQEYLEAGVDKVLTKPVLEKSLKMMLAIADERRKVGRVATDEASSPS